MLFFIVFRPPYPEHDSSQILAIKNSCYKQHIDAIRTYYKKEHQNWCVIDAFQSKWWIWNKVLQEVQVAVKEIQIYLERIREGKRKTKVSQNNILFFKKLQCNECISTSACFGLSQFLATYVPWNSSISSAEILKRSLEESKDKTNYRTVWGHPPKNRVTEYSWKKSEVSWSMADSSTSGDKSQTLPQSMQGELWLAASLMCQWRKREGGGKCEL